MYDKNRGTPGAFGSSRGGQNYSGRTPQGGKPAQQPIRPEPLPEDYVDEAERVIRKFTERDEQGRQPRCISTSKLRNLMSLASEIYNRENLRTGSALAPESIAGIDRLRIRTAYECGRDNKGTGDFVREAKLLEHLKWLAEKKDRSETIRFAHYMEALVAYHRYYGPKED